MAKLANCRMEEGSDPGIFFKKIDRLCEELEVVDEHVSQHRKMDIVMTEMPAEYDLTRFQPMKRPDFSLEEVQLHDAQHAHDEWIYKFQTQQERISDDSWIYQA